MSPTNCPKYETCGAPLCPLDPGRVEVIWYPDEPVCVARGICNRQFVRRQRRIIRVGADPELYYTYEMLDRRGSVRKGIQGLDPDKDHERQLTQWLKTHPEPEKKTYTPEQKKALIERLEGTK